jgi:hypothetical protein
MTEEGGLGSQRGVKKLASSNRAQVEFDSHFKRVFLIDNGIFDRRLKPRGIWLNAIEVGQPVRVPVTAPGK